MTLITLRGIPRRQVHEYLIEKGAEQIEECYRFTDYTVTILREELVYVGLIPFVELDISFEGKDDSVDEAVMNFRKSFIRMGG